MYYQSETYNRTRPSGGAWIYYNGELYHAGVKGMQWGKHLPGTTWWKETSDAYRNANAARTSYTDANGVPHGVNRYPSRLRTNLYTAGQAVKETAKDFNRAAQYDAARAVRERYAKNALINEQNKKSADFGNTRLDALSSRLFDSGQKYFNSLKPKDSSWGNILNLAIRQAGFNIVNGVNQFLKKRGWDVKVDNFLSKILYKKSNIGDAGYKTGRARTMSRQAEQEMADGRRHNVLDGGYKTGRARTMSRKEEQEMRAEMDRARRNRAFRRRPNIADPKMWQ